MFINQEIIAIIFKFINFIALISLGFFLFKKYVMPDLHASIIRKTENEKALLTQQASLEAQQITLDTFLKEDLFLCTQFRSKIDEWKQVTQEELLLHEKDHNKNIIAHHARVATIALQQEHTRIKQIVVHTVVTDLKKSLSLHFNDQAKNEKYLNSIFNFINEKIQ